MINRKINLKDLAKDMYWFNEPEYRIENESISIKTSSNTDFWQTTHYGFKRDNGHCYLYDITSDFCMKVKTRFEVNNQYDQCGLIVRCNEENWIIASTEFESANHSRLGSVVTNLGYSDWATIDIQSSINEMWYQIHSKNNLKDYLIEYSYDGAIWKQLRICHLLIPINRLSIGIYACSPTAEGSFDAIFSNLEIKKSEWE